MRILPPFSHLARSRSVAEDNLNHDEHCSKNPKRRSSMHDVGPNAPSGVKSPQ